MKKLMIAGLTLFLFSSCQQEKIAYVDNAKLLEEYQEKIDLDNSLKNRTEAFQKMRDSIIVAFRTENEDFNKKAQKMKKSVAEKKYGELVQKSQILQQQLQNEEQTIRVESQTKMDSLVNKVKVFIKEYGKDNGYSFILGSNNEGSVLYGEDSKDITKNLVEALNKEYKK